MLDVLGALVKRLSLHTAEPGDTGAHEVEGPLYYERKPVSWAPARGGRKANDVYVTFHLPAGVTVTHLGYWSESGTYYGSRPLERPFRFEDQGLLTLEAGDIEERLS